MAHYAAFIWTARATSRVKFFSWLLVQRRIHTRDVLAKKHIVAEVDAGCPIYSTTLETVDHLIFACPFDACFWQEVGVPTAGAAVDDLTFLASAGAVVGSAAEFVMLCCWQLWKHRNVVVFQGQRLSISRVLGCYREDAVLWRCRLPKNSRSNVDSWLTALSP
ncbi:uncharacterized protein [Aegilops tauschii subsp. strangulata]|uniref:uncharacterized protein n=1 Tax=Aegilops tauschii subsp. strangulata TaxID=200361 RepID=UPI003CC8A4DD